MSECGTMKDYLIFLSSDQNLAENCENKLTVIDLNTLEYLDVIGFVSSSPATPDMDRLWIRIDDLGDVRKSKKPKYIRILKSIQDEAGIDKVKHLVSDDLLSKDYDSTLAASEQNLKNILFTTGQWIWEMDINLRYTYVSSTVEKNLGFKPQDVIGRTFFDFLVDKDIKREVAFFDKSKETKAGFKDRFHQKCHRNGKTVWSVTTGFPIIDKNGNLKGWRGVDQDVTNRKKIEDQIYYYHKYLSFLNTLTPIQDMEESLDEMLYRIITHFCNVFTVKNVKFIIPYLDSDDYSLSEEGLKLRLIRKKLLLSVKKIKNKEKLFSIDDSLLHCNLKTSINSTPLLSFFEDGDQRFYICIPLQGKNEILGLIEFTRHEKDEFQHLDLGLMNALGIRIGLLIERFCFFDALKEREKEVKMVSARLVHAQENERQRISRILHDEVGQFLSSANIILESTEFESGANKEKCRKYLGKTKYLLKKAMERNRELSLELRPVILENIGLVAALQNIISQYQDGSNLKISFRNLGVHERLSESVELSFYRVAEESLRNVIRHANAKTVILKLVKSDNRIFLTVQDNGVGFDYQKKVSCAKGLGLKIMEERMNSIGGDFKIISKFNEGTMVFASVLLSRKEDGN